MSLLGAIPDRVEVVLLDVGGVLYVDPWETILFGPGQHGGGLVAALGLDRAQTEAAALAIWPRFATRESSEEEYWQALGDLIRRQLPLDLIRDISKRVLRPKSRAVSVLDEVQGRKLGVISDNTTFWYRRQRADLQLSGLVRPELEFVSSDAGRQKPCSPSLFDFAVERCDPASTLIVDDRLKNVYAARAVGFHTIHLPDDECGFR